MGTLLDDLNSSLENYLQTDDKVNEILNNLETATNVKKIVIARGVILVFAIYMIVGKFATLICNAVGFIYPAIQSLHALETPNPEDDSKWLTYWVVFAWFSVIEFYSENIFAYFPLYWLCKIIFLIWAFFPMENNGSIQIYRQIIRPYYLKQTGGPKFETDPKDTTGLPAALRSNDSLDKAKDSKDGKDGKDGKDSKTQLPKIEGKKVKDSKTSLPKIEDEDDL